MNPNIKIFSPNIKKENFIITNQHSPLNLNNNKFNSSLINKVGPNKNINNNQIIANGNTNKSMLNGKIKNYFKICHHFKKIMQKIQAVWIRL